MATIFQTFLNAFSGMKMFEFQIEFDWHFLQMVQLAVVQQWLIKEGLGAEQATSHYLNQ